MHPNGQLHLEFRRKDDGTSYISRQFFKLPLQVFPPNYLDGDGSAFLYLLNPSSGMLENDLFDIRFTLYDRAQALITTPSSNKIYRTKGPPARQNLSVSVGPGCVLEYLPDHNVPYRDSAYRQRGNFQVEKGGLLFTWDILQPGRVTRGELLDFSLYASENVFSYDGRLLLMERVQLEPKTNDYSGIGALAGRLISASCYLVGEDVDPELAPALTRRFEEAGVMGGASCPDDHLLVVRVLTEEIGEMQRQLYAVWDTIRRAVLNKPATHIRKY